MQATIGDKGRRLARAPVTAPHLLYLLARRDPGSLRFAGPWIKSFFAGHTPLRDQVPWIPFKARQWLDGFLTAEMRVFEYGSGGSTLFMARRAGALVSVEHDSDWHAEVSRTLAAEEMANCTYLLREPLRLDGGRNGYASTRPEFEGFSFEPYVTSIDPYPDASFDLVVVDGRARAACLARARQKVRPGGYLMLDNSERREYEPAMDLLADRDRTDFYGVAPGRTYLWQTTIWEL